MSPTGDKPIVKAMVQGRTLLHQQHTLLTNGPLS